MKKSHIRLYFIVICILFLNEFSFSYSAKYADLPHNLNKSAIEHLQKNLASAKDFSFVVLGDSRKNQKRFKQVLNEAAKKDPAFIIHTGDITSQGKYRHYLKALETVKDFAVPMICVPGNHDLKDNGKQWFSYIFGPIDFFFDAGPYRFICVDNTDEKVEATFIELTGQQTDKNKSDKKTLLQLLNEKKRVFIIMHIPPPLPIFNFHSFKGDSKQFLQTVETYSHTIQGVFCGHIHGYGESSIGNVPCVVTGGAGARLTRGRNSITGKHNYVLVTIKNNTVCYKPYFIE